MYYTTLHYLRHYMHDDRLAQVVFAEDATVLFAYRYGHIAPALVHAMASLSRDVATSGVLQLDLSNRGRPPKLMCWLEPGTLDDDDPVMNARIGPGDDNGLPPFFEVQIRSEHIDPALVREMNEYAFPEVCGVLVPSAGAEVNA